MARLQALSTQYAHQVDVLPSSPFPLVSSLPISPATQKSLRVYLEGDGHAWATPQQPSLDPSPQHLLLARLALSDPRPSVYLARPCQFVSTAGCTPRVWTDQRFSTAVLQSLDQALDHLKQRYGNRDFELIGYSGGAALALLLATQRDDIRQVQTLAGNLSPRLWAETMGLSPLTGSLDPMDQARRLAQVRQRHLLGEADRNVPASLYPAYRHALGAQATCVEAVSLPGVSHEQGWTEVWPHWRDQPLHCGGASGD